MLDSKNVVLRSLRLERIYLFAIILLGVMAPLLALDGSFHVAGGDMTHPEFDISTSIEKSMYIWQSSKGLGINEASTIPALFPYYASIWLLETVGFSAEVTQKILLIVVFALAGPAMFYLMRTLFPEKKHLHAAFIAALSYLFNFFNLQSFWQPYFNYQLVYAMMPILLGVYVKGLKTGDRKYLYYFVLVSLLNASSAMNYALVVVQLLVLFLYTLWVLAFSENRVVLVKRIAQYGIVFFAASSFWLIPAIVWFFTASQSYGLGDIISRNLGGQISLTGQYGTPINTFRLWGFAWFFKDGPEWSYPIHILYSQDPLLVLLGFIPPIMAFSALLFVRKGNERAPVLFFSLSALFGLFMMKGTALPFGEVFRWVLDNSSSFSYLFKNPFNKFGMLATLSYAILTGLAVNNFGIRFKHKLTPLIVMLLASLFISGLFFPYWTGEAVRPRFKVNIPSSYSEVGHYLNSDNNFYRVLPLPIHTVNNFKVYGWGYSGAGIDQYFVRSPLVDRNFEIGGLETERVIRLMEEAASRGDAAQVIDLCRHYSIGKIIYHNDADPTFYTEELYQDSWKRILSAPPFVLEKSFCELDLYKIEDYLPQIYAQPALGKETPGLVFENINPTKHIVHVTGATEPYYLILSESFNPYWKAHIVDTDQPTSFRDTLSGNPISEENHFVVNGYANAWYISKPGNYTVIIEFSLQRFVYLGLVISALTGVSAIVALGLGNRRIRHTLSRAREAAFSRNVAIHHFYVSRFLNLANTPSGRLTQVPSSDASQKGKVKSRKLFDRSGCKDVKRHA